MAPPGRAAGATPGQRKWAAEVGRAPPPVGSAGPLRLGASRALLPASRAPGCPQRPDFGQPNWQATLPKNACGAGEPAARYRRLVWGAAEASWRGGGGDGSFVAFAWHCHREALDGIRLRFRPAVSRYNLEDVVDMVLIGIVGLKLLGMGDRGSSCSRGAKKGSAASVGLRTDVLTLRRNYRDAWLGLVRVALVLGLARMRPKLSLLLVPGPDSRLYVARADHSR